MPQVVRACRDLHYHAGVRAGSTAVKGLAPTCPKGNEALPRSILGTRVSQESGCILQGERTFRNTGCPLRGWELGASPANDSTHETFCCWSL